MKKSAHLIILASLFFLWAFSCENKEPDRPDANEIESAIEPSSPTPNGSLKNGAAEKATPPFTIMVKNAFVFDASTDPFTRNITQEKGICLLAVGSVRNDTDKIIHRGGLFGTLTTTFAKAVKIVKHTSGMGFLPPVSSREPWRPGAWRNFRLVTRALDPIYREYIPLDLEAEIVLEVRDPLNYRLRSPLSTFRLPWRSLKGAPTSGSAAILEAITPISFEKPGTRRFQPGDLVKVCFQKGAGYKVLNENNLGGWLPYRSLQLDLEDFRILPPKKPPTTVQSGDISFTLERFSITDGPEKHLKIFTVQFKINNHSDKTSVSVKSVDFMYEFGPVDAPTGKLQILKDNSFKATTGWIIKANSSDTLKYFSTHPADKLPLEFIWWRSPKRRISVSLM